MKEDITARTPLKGFEFERWVYDNLCEIARSSKAGDEIEQVSTETSESLANSKKGDFHKVRREPKSENSCGSQELDIEAFAESD